MDVANSRDKCRCSYGYERRQTFVFCKLVSCCFILSMSLFRRLKRIGRTWLSDIATRLGHDNLSFFPGAEICSYGEPHLKFDMPLREFDSRKGISATVLPATHEASPFVMIASTNRHFSSSSEEAKKPRRLSWCRRLRTPAFLLMVGGAFCAGKLVSVGITIAVAVISKLILRYKHRHTLNNSCPAPFPLAEHKPVVAPGKLRRSRRIKLPPSVSPLEEMESPSCTSNFTIEEEPNSDVMTITSKRLRRLNCIKNSTSSSPYSDLQSPLSATLTRRDGFATPQERKVHSRFRHKWFRHLRKQEAVSVPTSPMGGNSQYHQIGSFSRITFQLSDYSSDSEIRKRSTRKRSCLNPASCSASKEAKEADSCPFQKSIRKTNPQPGNELQEHRGHEPASISEISKSAAQRSSLNRASCPASEEATADHSAAVVPLHFPERKLGKELRKGGGQEAERVEHYKSARKNALHPTIASGLIVALAGLSLGRTMAVFGVVCWWFAVAKCRISIKRD